jgi:hypothetical protein
MRLHPIIPAPQHCWRLWPALCPTRPESRPVDLLLPHGSIQRSLCLDSEHADREYCRYCPTLSADLPRSCDGLIGDTGHTKKVVTNAVLFLGYCTGNIAGPFFYKTNQKYVAFSFSIIVIDQSHPDFVTDQLTPSASGP